MGTKASRVGTMEAAVTCLLMAGTILIVVLALATSARAQDTAAGNQEESGWIATNRGASQDPASDPGRRANLRQAEGDLAGKRVDARDTDGSGVVDLATIQAEDCSVAPAGATLTIEDSDGTTGLLEDGANVEITATETEVRIVGTGPNNDIFFGAVGGDDDTFSGDATVLRSTGIECGGGADDDDDGDGNGNGDGGTGGTGGQGGQFSGVCQNIIGSIGDITQTQTGNANAAAEQYADAVADIAQEQGVSITQANECLNGAADTGGDDTGGDTVDGTDTDDIGSDDAGSMNTPEDVLSATIPDQKVLANTGGPAVLLPALGLLLVSSVVLRNLLRR